MHPQYVAPQSSSYIAFEALESQGTPTRAVAYQSDGFSAMLTSGRIKATVTLRLKQAGSIRPVGFVLAIRRLKCPRASNCSQWSALLPPSRPAAMASRKNLSWSTQNPFRSNRSTLANTNKLRAGPARQPVPPFPARHTREARACCHPRGARIC